MNIFSCTYSKTDTNSLHCALVVLLLLRPGTGAEYCDQPVCLCVYLSVNISLELLNQSSQNFACRTPVPVAPSSSGGVVLRYVLLVLWMMSHVAVMGVAPERVGSTRRRRSITCTNGAESGVYECLLLDCCCCEEICRELRGSHARW